VGLPTRDGIFKKYLIPDAVSHDCVKFPADIPVERKVAHETYFPVATEETTEEGVSIKEHTVCISKKVKNGFNVYHYVRRYKVAGERI